MRVSLTRGIDVESGLYMHTYVLLLLHRPSGGPQYDSTNSELTLPLHCVMRDEFYHPRLRRVLPGDQDGPPGDQDGPPWATNGEQRRCLSGVGVSLESLQR